MILVEFRERDSGVDLVELFLSCFEVEFGQRPESSFPGSSALVKVLQLIDLLLRADVIKLSVSIPMCGSWLNDDSGGEC